MVNKLSKLLIISMLLVVMVVPAFAEDKVMEDDTAKITITNISGQAKESINIYGETKEYDVYLVTEGAKITIESKTGIRAGIMGLGKEDNGSYYEDPWPWDGTGEFRMYIDGGMTGYNVLEKCDYYSFFYEKDGKDVNMMFKMVKSEEPTKETENVVTLTIDSLDAKVDDSDLKLNQAPFIKKETNRTLVPVRFVSEALGANVKWVAETRQVIITQDDKEVVLTIDSDKVKVNNNESTIDSPAEIVNNKTFVPLRFVSEALGAKVEFNAETKAITIKK